jgi:ParB family protein of integrating conjugative element (PFGI_1 class)
MNQAVRTPKSISVEALARAKGLVPNTTASARERLAQAQAAVRSSLSVPNPASASDGKTMDFDPDGGRIDLPVLDIALYEDNPRESLNPNYAEIKESIRARGLDNPLQVTRRPGAKSYMLCYGGGTRLRILRELLAETGEERFRVTQCIYRTWKSEAHIMASHMAENEQRGDMSFWDKAQGVAKLKAKLEKESATPEKELGLRELERRMKELGYLVNLANLSNWLFAHRTLKVLGQQLKKDYVKKIQPIFNLHSRFAKLAGHSEDDFLEACFIPAQHAFVAEVEGTELSLEQLDLFLLKAQQHLAKWLGQDLTLLPSMLVKLEEFPDLSLTDLHKAISQSSVAQSFPPPPSSFSQSSGVNEGDADGEQDDFAGEASNPFGLGGVQNGGQSVPQTIPTVQPLPGIDDPATMSAKGASSPSAPMLQTPKAPPKLPPITRFEMLQRDVPKLTEKLWECCEALAKTAQIVFELDKSSDGHGEGMPFGLWVNFPTRPYSNFANASDKQLAWWTICLVSQQLDIEAAKFLPESSNWRQSILGESNAPNSDHHARVLSEIGGCGVDLMLLANVTNSTAKMCVQVLALYHQVLPMSRELGAMIYEMKGMQNDS